MDKITPVALDVKDFAQIDGAQITTNLFKDTSVRPHAILDDKLATFLRIRPNDATDKSRWFIIDNHDLLVASVKEGKKFVFSQIYGEKTSQEDFFKDCALPLVSKVVQGSSALLFAYGTTSSGKSFTMRGTPDNPGVVPRAINHIFTTLRQKISCEPLFKRKKFSDCQRLSPNEVSKEMEILRFIVRTVDGMRSMKASTSSILSLTQISSEPLDDFSNIQDSSTFPGDGRVDIWISVVEFHNEKPIDLLSVVELDEKKTPVPEVLSDGSVKRLQHVFAPTAEDAIKIFMFAQENLKKHIHATSLNEHSSRSHCVFNLTMISYSPHANQTHVRTLSLADLAGTERTNRTKNTGDRQVEAGKINKSLMYLRQVIARLRLNQKNVGGKEFIPPFRDSKLTKTFKPFFDGNNSASMIINVNPDKEYMDESLYTLEFSETAADVVVSTEESRINFQDTLKRLTQVWMQSTQRWSTFAEAAGISKRTNQSSWLPSSQEAIMEEDDENEILDDAEVSFITDNLSLWSEIDLQGVDPKILNKYRKLQELMLERFEDEKLHLEVKVRHELVKEMAEITEEMRQNHLLEKNQQRVRLEDLMITRLDIVRRQNARDADEYEDEVTKLKDTNFRLTEELVVAKIKNEEMVKQLSETCAQIKPRAIPESCPISTSTEDLMWRHCKSTAPENFEIVQSSHSGFEVGTNTELYTTKDSGTLSFDHTERQDQYTTTVQVQLNSCPTTMDSVQAIRHVSTETDQMMANHKQVNTDFVLTKDAEVSPMRVVCVEASMVTEDNLDTDTQTIKKLTIELDKNQKETVRGSRTQQAVEDLLRENITTLENELKTKNEEFDKHKKEHKCQKEGSSFLLEQCGSPILVNATRTTSISRNNVCTLSALGASTSALGSNKGVVDKYIQRIGDSKKIELEATEPIAHDDIGQVCFPPSEKKPKLRKGRRNMDTKDVTVSKRKKMPFMETRSESVSPIPEDESERARETRPYPLRSRRKLNKL